MSPRRVERRRWWGKSEEMGWVMVVVSLGEGRWTEVDKGGREGGWKWTEVEEERVL